ncbi:MAG: hypothetical protein EOO73_13690 [Myxococcales bacterium]|nr:MAG: hypothetical protein EOO73_13690 [Myxococcales bacterium]
MKIIVYAVVGCSLMAGCSSQGDGNESVGSSSQELNGQLGSRSNLTRKTLALEPASLQNDESIRQGETLEYYNSVGVAANGSTTGAVPNCTDAQGAAVAAPRTIKRCLNTLDDFIKVYGFSAAHTTAFYYNRGDLGIGREMHCIDRTSTTGEIACYVKNFAAGDDNSEFTFGMSKDIAFRNMATQNAFATVAMVYRHAVPAGGANRVLFAVYGKSGTLINAAALDRHGINFNNEFAGVVDGTPNPNPNPSIFGEPGVNFNNHIPTNCISCHGGDAYDAASNSQKGALFLPFDLDQFEYEDAPTRTKESQLGQFRALNQIVRKVATQSEIRSETPAATNVKNQIDGWYPDSSNSFNSAFVPTGWKQNPAAESVYRSVVRSNCRGCHMTSKFFPFNTEGEFLPRASNIADLLCRYEMPHALQTVREFWQSPAPSALRSYFQNSNNGAAASTLGACGPGNIATLDPPQILASASAL